MRNHHILLLPSLALLLGVATPHSSYAIGNPNPLEALPKAEGAIGEYIYSYRQQLKDSERVLNGELGKAKRHSEHLQSLLRIPDKKNINPQVSQALTQTNSTTKMLENRLQEARNHSASTEQHAARAEADIVRYKTLNEKRNKLGSEIMVLQEKIRQLERTHAETHQAAIAAYHSLMDSSEAIVRAVNKNINPPIIRLPSVTVVDQESPTLTTTYEVVDGQLYKKASQKPIHQAPAPNPPSLTQNPGKPVTAYPASWGQPPRVQTQDIVSLPLGGRGSSTLRNWQNKNIREHGWPPNFKREDRVGTTQPTPTLGTSPTTARDLLR